MELQLNPPIKGYFNRKYIYFYLDVPEYVQIEQGFY